jgi:D-amino peptidase
VALVCGDDTVDAEVGTLMPHAERVITKWALSPLAARNLTPKAAQQQIRAGAERALGRLGQMEPVALDRPVRFEVDFMRPLYAYMGADIPGVELVEGRTLVYTGADMLEVTRIWRLMINASLGEFYV